jgi:murein DD-endopeptidase MepM/ murein hydrolase activator NlpD
MKVDAAVPALGLASAPTATPRLPRPAKNDAQTAGAQLEAFFLRQLLSETRPQGGMLDGGFAGDTFKQMLDEALADKMTAAGGIGLAKMFADQLGKTHETAAAPAVANAPLGAPGSGAPLDRPAGAPHFILPVAGRPSSGYGLRTDPIEGTTVNHPGFDLAAKAGTEVAAAARGTVVQAGPAGSYGNLVTLRHDDGFETRYAHLSAVGVKVGDVIEAGQQIGAVGTTGHSTGPHLHFEIRQNGRPVDPAPLLPLHSFPARTTR